jgi:hypothetical protein
LANSNTRCALSPPGSPTATAASAAVDAYTIHPLVCTHGQRTAHCPEQRISSRYHNARWQQLEQQLEPAAMQHACMQAIAQLPHDDSAGSKLHTSGNNKTLLHVFKVQLECLHNHTPTNTISSIWHDRAISQSRRVAGHIRLPDVTTASHPMPPQPAIRSECGQPLSGTVALQALH